MKNLIFLLMLTTISACAAKTPHPTMSGDQIGIVTMLPDRSIQMQLRSVECNGTIAHTAIEYHVGDKAYEMIRSEYGLVSPADSKPVIAGQLAPCPK